MIFLVWRGWAWHGEARLGRALANTLHIGAIQCAEVWQGWAWHGEAGLGKALANTLGRLLTQKFFGDSKQKHKNTNENTNGKMDRDSSPSNAQWVDG